MKLLWLAIFIAFCGISESATTYPCEPTTEVRTALNDAPNVFDFTQSLEERLRPIRALAAKYPHDLFVQMRYQDRFRRQTHLYQEFDRALAMYRVAPGDPVSRFLEARLTASFDAVKAEAMLTELIAAAPDFPWPHLAVAELTDRSAFRDAKKAETHLRAFLAACPASVEGYAMLRTVEDPQMISDGAKKLRGLLEGRMDAGSLPYWNRLWDLELRAAPKGTEDAARARIARDAEAIEKLPPVRTRDWYDALTYAATLTKNDVITKWRDAVVLHEYPKSEWAAQLERNRWNAENPQPARGASAETVAGYRARQQAAAAEVARRFPHDFNVILDRWMYIDSAGADWPIEEKLAAEDAVTALLAQSPDAGTFTPPIPIAAADHNTRWRARLDGVPALLRAGLKQAELEAKYRPAASMAPEQFRDRAADSGALTFWRADLVMADYYLAEKRPAEARDAIENGLAGIEARPMYPLNAELSKRDIESRRNSWRPRQAQLAELEGNAPMALLFYQKFTQSWGRKGLSTGVFTGEIQGQIDAAKRLYLAAGGKAEQWLDWASEPAAIAPGQPRTLEFPAMLGDFEAKDLSGKTWRLEDLKGKATLIDAWATWCGPCRAQNPLLQQLYEQIKDRKDIQILTFSIDENALLPQEYMRDEKYGFPVIASKDLAEKLFAVLGIPQQWIVDAAGRRSAPYTAPPGDFARIVADLEAAAKAK
jgi:thiol-disulfide isomerase/thioredoxin